MDLRELKEAVVPMGTRDPTFKTPTVVRIASPSNSMGQAQSTDEPEDKSVADREPDEKSNSASPQWSRPSLSSLRDVRPESCQKMESPPPSTSMAAASILNSWKRNSIGNRESNSSSGSRRHQTNNGGRPSLSELSQEMLKQVIRLFPFPSPQSGRRRPALCRTLSASALSSAGISRSSKSAPSTPTSVKTVEPDERPAERSSTVTKGASGYSSQLGRLRRVVSHITRRERKTPQAAEGTPNKKDGALSRLCRVSVDTMAITALPAEALECWLKERLRKWVQLSGHQGTIVPASNHTLWKKQPRGSHSEARAYAEIMRDPSLRGITPKFYRETGHKNETFIEIQDLLADFPDTSSRAVMDIKLGTRTFLESEVENELKRTDLYKKMMELAVNEPTEEEHLERAITKLRYMQFRERESSSATLGFRIEAAQMPGGGLEKNFKRVRGRKQVREVLDQFMNHRETIRCQLLTRLRHIREAVEKSHFFANHEVVGSSLLIVHDQCRAGAWLIDFAKSTRVSNSGRLNHREPWEPGNQEDGYLTGLDELVAVLGEQPSPPPAAELEDT